MSMPILYNTALSIGAFWMLVLIFVIVQSMLGLSILGVKPEAVRLILLMTSPLTVGISAVVIGVAFLIARRRRNIKA